MYIPWNTSFYYSSSKIIDFGKKLSSSFYQHHKIWNENFYLHFDRLDSRKVLEKCPCWNFISENISQPLRRHTTLKTWSKTNIGILRIFRNNFIIFLLFESSEKMWKYINYEFDVYFKKCVERASRFLKSLKSQNVENFLKILGHRRLAIWASKEEY